MNLTDVPTGTPVFIDANVFVYAYSSEPTRGSKCFDFLNRVARGDVFGHSSSLVVSDVAHRLMSLEACTAFGWPFAAIAQRLKRNPNDVNRLQAFRDAVGEICRSSLHVASVGPQDVLTASEISVQHGLLSGDALVVAIMRRLNLTNLASNDADFDRVPGLTRYGPT
jgi:predicted nucleic acid-binding protein